METCPAEILLIRPPAPGHERAGGPQPEERRPEARPGPEALYLGLERWAVTRNQLDVPQFRRFCRALIEDYVDLLEMLARQGARLCIVGVAGSPNCGVATTSSGYTGGRVREVEHAHVAERGVFMEELLVKLERRNVSFQVERGRQERRHWRRFLSVGRAGLRILQVHEIGCLSCRGCQARSKALDSGSSHEGVRGFEYHPPHLNISILAL